MRARIVVVGRGADAGATRPQISAIRARRGPLGHSGGCIGRLELPSSDLTIDLVGGDAETLGELLTDLQAHLVVQRKESAIVARVYSKDGVAARDPRTGATLLRQRDLLKGELQRFFDAWRARSASSRGGDKNRDPPNG